MFMNHQNSAAIIPFVKEDIRRHKDIYKMGKNQKVAVSYLYKGVYLPYKIITIISYIYNSLSFFLFFKKTHIGWC